MASKLALRAMRNITKSGSMLTRNVLAFKQTIQPIITPSVTQIKFFGTERRESAYGELTSFLSEEIKLEKDAQRHKTSMPTIKGFDIKTEGPNVTLTRDHNSEKISIKFNINNTLADEETSEQLENEKEPAAMKSRPTFCVDIKKGSQTLSFWCSFLPSEIEGETKSQTEDFQIDEFAIHEGEWNENVYSADCSVLDGNLYDILLNVLEERGIGEEFANQMMEFSTAYEHKQYIGLLEKLKDFAKV